MPRFNQQTAKVLAAYYLSFGCDKYKALVETGYSTSYSKSKGIKLFDREETKQAITQLQNKQALTSNITVDELLLKCKTIYEGDKTTNRDKLSAMSLVADMCGFKRETAPNAERELQKRQALTIEQAKVADIVAKIRVDAESGANIVKVG